MQSLTASEFRDKAIQYVIDNTGIPVSFGTVIALGCIGRSLRCRAYVQSIRAGEPKALCGAESHRTRNGKLILMVMLQASVVGFVGFSLGLFGAAFFFESAGRNSNFAGFYLPWQIGVISG